jgi:hypothetical protein
MEKTNGGLGHKETSFNHCKAKGERKQRNKETKKQIEMKNEMRKRTQYKLLF